VQGLTRGMGGVPEVGIWDHVWVVRSKIERVVRGSMEEDVPPAREIRIPPWLVPRPGTKTTALSALGGDGNVAED
jgi:hypothetical protein